MKGEEKDDLKHEAERLRRRVDNLEWHLERSHSAQRETFKEQDRTHKELEFYKKKLRDAENQLQARAPTVNDGFSDQLRSIEAQYRKLEADREEILKRHAEELQEIERKWSEELQRKLEEERRNIEVKVLVNSKAIPIPVTYQDADVEEGSVEQSVVEAIGSCRNGKVETPHESESPTAPPPATENSQLEVEGINITASAATENYQLEGVTAPTKVVKTSTRRKRKKRQAKPRWSKRRPGSQRTTATRQKKIQQAAMEFQQTGPPEVMSTHTDGPSANDYSPTRDTLEHSMNDEVEHVPIDTPEEHMNDEMEPEPLDTSEERRNDEVEPEPLDTSEERRNDEVEPEPLDTSEESNNDEVEPEPLDTSEETKNDELEPELVGQMVRRSRSGKASYLPPASKKPEIQSGPVQHAVGSIVNGRYYCACGTHFASKYVLSTHVKQHIQELVFPCPIPSCKLRFVSGSKMKLHMKIKHNIHDDVLQTFFVVSCSVCGSWFRNRLEWRQHQLREGHVFQNKSA